MKKKAKMKLINNIFLMSILLFGALTISITTTNDEKIKINDITPQMELVDETISEFQEANSEANGYSSSSLSRGYGNSSYSSANMINHNLSTKVTSYENFNSSSYENRNNSLNVTNFMLSKSEITINDNEIEKSESYIPNDVSYAVSPSSILGSDDRTQVTDTKSWPYLGIVKMYMTFKNVLNQTNGVYRDLTYVGTGFMEGPNLMVTAGHCGYYDVTSDGIYEDNINNPRFPDMIQVYAGLNGYSERTSSYKYYAEVSVINIQKEYYEKTGFDYDWSAMQLDRNLGNQTGYYGKISNWYSNNAPVYSYGYPGDKPDTMWETYGNLTGKSTYRYKYNFDTVGGQSGSPVFMVSDSGDVYVCGIHTSGGSTSNGATRINTFIFSYLNSFVTNHNYEHVAATITPSDYGFADAYPTVVTNKSHTLSTGFEFTTTRYRTGFIQGEYIVMSPFRTNINKAYIEYKFNVPVTKIDVDLTHWRSLSTEWTYDSNCTVELRTESGYKLNLLSKEMNLPTDRTQPTTYTIVFDKPVYSFGFYMESKKTNINDSNRGRLCIGDMKIYTTEGWY